jgi:RNA polymerase sigma-70 factor, ECF subfamily
MFHLARNRFMPAPTNDLRDPAAFARAYAQHARAVRATAMAVLNDAAAAQDVVQDVFLRVWRRPGAFDPRRGALGPYLRLMARSRALEVWREGRAANRAGERLAFVADRAARVDAAQPTAPADGDLWSALKGLPPGQRQAVVLAYVGGLTAAEIADVADVPLGTAKSRVRLGLTKLRRSYGEPRAAA